MQPMRLAVGLCVPVLLWSAAATTRASRTFNVLSAYSQVRLTQVLDLGEVSFGVNTSTPQYPDPDGAGYYLGSDTASVSGTIEANWDGSTFELLSGNFSWSAYRSQGAGGVPGAFHPFDPVTQDPAGVPGGVTLDANYGLKWEGAGGQLLMYKVWHDVEAQWSTTAPGPRPWNSSTGEFAYVTGGDFLIATSGREAFTSQPVDGIELLNGTRSLVGEPLAALRTHGVAYPTWKPRDQTLPFGTLRLPIESAMFTEIDLGHIYPGIRGYLYTYMEGQLMGTLVAPEPSSIALLALGAAGLLLGRWRFGQARWARAHARR